MTGGSAFHVGTRYLQPRWDELRRRSGLSDEQVMKRTIALFDQACGQGLKPYTVIHYRLDNPFMHDHARATAASQARKDMACGGAGMPKTLAGRRINALEGALAEAVDYIIRDTRNIIECGTLDYDLTKVSKETRAAIDFNNALLRSLNGVLTGHADPAGLCKFCRCMGHSACTLPDGEPCAWWRENVCTNPPCVKAWRREQGLPAGRSHAKKRARK